MELNLIEAKQQLISSIEAVSQARSNYAIEHFVVGEHVTPQRQYVQAVNELYIKLNNIRREEVRLRKLQKQLIATTDEDDRELIALDIEEISFSLLSQKREAGTLYAIYNSFPKYTYEDIQIAEEEYWVERLSRQASLDIEASGRVSVGNLDALRMAGVLNNDFADRFIQSIQPKELK